MPGSTNEAGSAVVGANGTDQRALALLDALGARLVEAIKAGVNATSDGLGVLAEETDRLDERISALASQLERHATAPVPSAPSIDLAPVYETIAELLERHAVDTAAEPAPALDLTPVYEAIAELRQAILERDDRDRALGVESADTADAVRADVVAAVESIRAEMAELRAAIADRSAAAEPAAAVEPDLSPVHDVVRQETAQLRESVLAELAELRAAVRASGNNAPVVDAVGSRLAELRGTLQGRIDALHSTVAAGADLSPLTAELTTAITGLAERLDRIEAGVGSGPDLTPLTAQVAEAREELAERVEQLHVSMAIDTELSSVRHDAVAGRLAALEQELHNRAGHQDVVDAVHTIRTGIDALTDRLSQSHGASADELRDAQDTILAAVDQLSADVAGVRERATANVETNARAAREVHDAITAIDERVAARIAEVSAAITQGPDLTPVIDSISALEQQIHDVRDAVDHVSPGTAMQELLRSLGDVRTALLESHGALSGEMADSRSSVERWLAQIDSTVANTNGAAAEDLGLLLDVAEELRTVAGSTAERSEATEQRLAAIESSVSEAGRRLADVADRTAASANRTADVLAWTEAMDLQGWVADLRLEMNAKLDAVVASLPGIEERMTETEHSVRRGSELTNATLEGLRAHLASGGGFSGQIERFREIRAALDQLAAAVGDGTDDLGPSVVAAIEDAANRAVVRMEARASDALAKVERRDEDIIRHTDELTTSVGRSIENIESDLREVITGLSASERFVRSRFTEVEVAISELRHEVAHVRTLRASLDTLTSSLDAARLQARMAAVVQHQVPATPQPAPQPEGD